MAFEDAFELSGEQWSRASDLGKEIARREFRTIIEPFVRLVTNESAGKLQTGKPGAATARLNALRTLRRLISDAETELV